MPAPLYPSLASFKNLLHKHGLKATGQRLAVHEAMLDLIHGSADTVSAHIAAKGEQKVSVASVYTILSQMAELGIYTRRMGGGSKMVFDVRSGNHLHLYDLETDSFRDVPDDDLIDLIERNVRRRFKGYTIDHIDVQFVCRPSKRKNAKKI